MSSSTSIVQGIEHLTAALKSNIVPDQEYLLQGSILDPHVEVLKHRLRGLCDNVEDGQENFAEKEMVFSLQGASAGNQPLQLRVRRPLLAGGGATSKKPDCPWQLRYVGQPELANRPVVVRSCYDIACSENVVDFLRELGCRLDYEFAAKGFLFRKGRLRVSVCKIHKLSQGENPVEGLTNSHLVEVSVLAPSGSDAVAEDVRNFSEQLKPLVSLEKVDPRSRMP